jgi:hypothetical protein
MGSLATKNAINMSPHKEIFAVRSTGFGVHSTGAPLPHQQLPKVRHEKKHALHMSIREGHHLVGRQHCQVVQCLKYVVLSTVLSSIIHKFCK